MKKITLFAVALLLAGTAFTQNYLMQVKPTGGKTWGYANLKGEIVIPPSYTKCNKFSDEGLALIYEPSIKQFYFIDTKGNKFTTEVIDFRPREIFGFGVKGFEDGMCPVKVGEKWGAFNAKGKLVVPSKYDKLSEYNSGHCVAELSKNFYILDKNGKETAVTIPGLIDVREFSEGLAHFRLSDKKVGFIGPDASIAIPAQFLSVGSFHGGLAWARASNEMVGYIDKKGNWVIQPQYRDGKDFDPVSGMARVKIGEKWAYVNKLSEVLNVDTESYGDFVEGLARGKKNAKVGFFDNKGTWVIAPLLDNANDFHNGYATARQGEKLWGVIDKNGKWVIPATFEDIKDVELVK